MDDGTGFAQRPWPPRVTPKLGPQPPLWVPIVGLKGPFADGPTPATGDIFQREAPSDDAGTSG